MKHTIGKYTLALTHLDKPLVGEYSKGAIIDYYSMIGSKMIPYLRDHPLMMHRFPEGLTGESFYQKHIADYFPAWIKRVPINKVDGSYHAILCQNIATLVYITNQACITPHIWLSRFDKLATPDRIIFDLDPPDNDFFPLKTIARSFKKLFDTLEIGSFVMTSGSKGLHIYIPLRRTISFDLSKEFAQLCAIRIVATHPELCTLELRKDKRHHKIFIDTLRNQQGATSVAPYAIRAYPNAPIATPLFWEELEDPNLFAQSYTIENITERITQAKDPWSDFFMNKQSITKALKILQSQQHTR